MISEPRRKKRKNRLSEDPVEATIGVLSSEGRGIAHLNERTVFISNALANEQVLFKYTRLTKKIAEGRAIEILQPSPDRVKPRCQVFDICGGCSLQHMSASSQLSLKQKMLLDQLEHTGQTKPERVLETITGSQWAYRHKARLGVRYVEKKGKVLVGFRERGTSFITDTDRCEILHKTVGEIITPLSECIGGMDVKRQIPQIEVAVGDNQTVLVFRHLESMPENDRALLVHFAQKYELVIYLQSGSPDTLEPLWPATPDVLHYVLPDHDVRIEFQPMDFTQVNHEINRKMVNAAIDLLQLEQGDTVLDLFCGLGNFSLPLARHCTEVVAVEGSLPMVNKGRENAKNNNIENIEFIYADLYSEDISQAPWLKKKYNKILLDPPRSGAAEVIRYFTRLGAKKIVYVSCHPATLARDANVLVNELGYKLSGAGIMDMFPHTEHVESIAVFEKG